MFIEAKLELCGTEALSAFLHWGAMFKDSERGGYSQATQRVPTRDPLAETNVVMVGDSYAADITGGINAGLLATIWVRPDDGGAGGGTPSMMHDHVSDVPAGKPPPTFTVGSVLELEAILEKIR